MYAYAEKKRKTEKEREENKTNIRNAESENDDGIKKKPQVLFSTHSKHITLNGAFFPRVEF